MWQLLQDMPPGARCGASTGVFVKMRNPRLISCDSLESSSVASMVGSFGYTHAAFMVSADAMSGPAIFGPFGGGAAAGDGGAAGWEQAARNAATAKTCSNLRRVVRVVGQAN
jgi:hypothetical protein